MSLHCVKRVAFLLVVSLAIMMAFVSLGRAQTSNNNVIFGPDEALSIINDTPVQSTCSGPWNCSFKETYETISRLPCFTCTIVNQFVVLGDYFSKRTFTELAPALRMILVYLFLLYMTFQIMKLFVPLGEYASSPPFKRIAVAILYYIFAFAALSPSYYGLFFQYIYDPLLDFGVGASAYTLQMSAAACSGSGFRIVTSAEVATSLSLPQVSMGSSDASGAVTGLSRSSMETVLPPLNALMENVKSVASLGIAVGVYSMFQGQANVFVQFFLGLVLVFIYAYVLIAAGFYIIDVLFRAFLVVAAMPIFIAGIVIPPIRGWFVKGVQGILQSALTLLFAGVIYGIGASLLCGVPAMFGYQGMSGFEQAIAQGAVTITAVDPIFWVLVSAGILMQTAVRRASALAGQFADAAFSSADAGIGRLLGAVSAAPVAYAQVQGTRLAIGAVTAPMSAGTNAAGRAASYGFGKFGSALKSTGSSALSGANRFIGSFRTKP